MRLFYKDGDGIREVDSSGRLAGIYDAVDVARGRGDGEYIFDNENGYILNFGVEQGEPRVQVDAWEPGNAGAVVDEQVRAENVSNPASGFGGFFGFDDEVVGAWETPAPEDVPVQEAPPEVAPEETGPVAEEAPADHVQHVEETP